MRFQYASLRSQPPMLQPLNPCPVCGAKPLLREIEPHPLHANFEIHGYLCDRCGPIKSLVVLSRAATSINLPPLGAAETFPPPPRPPNARLFSGGAAAFATRSGPSSSINDATH